MAEAEAPALAPSEPIIITVSDVGPLSAGSRSCQGSDPAPAASAHHLRMAEAEAPTLTPREPITTVSDGRALSADGRSHQGSDPTPAADPRQGARAGDDSASHFSATAPPAADGATATAASAAGAGVAAAPAAAASVAGDDAHAPGASGADADMAVEMATGVIADGALFASGLVSACERTNEDLNASGEPVKYASELEAN